MPAIGPKSSTRLNISAFTLVEVMVTVAVIAILVFVSVGAYSKWVSHAENATCLKRMKDIGVALGNYVATNDQWPQQPDSHEDADEEKVWEWWVKKMEPYGIAQSTWLCPTDERERKRNAAESGVPRDKYEVTYIPTDFDDGRDTAYKWLQPWLIERSEYHPNGQNVLMPDGSIRPFLNPMNIAPKKK